MVSVVSMIEAILEIIYCTNPNIPSIILQSDNTKCYNNNELIFMLALLNTRTKVKIKWFIHTETQDGKGLIDAHFAHATVHIKHFICTFRRNPICAIATPRGLAAAVLWNGGIQNLLVQMCLLIRTSWKEC